MVEYGKQKPAVSEHYAVGFCNWVKEPFRGVFFVVVHNICSYMRPIYASNMFLRESELSSILDFH